MRHFAPSRLLRPATIMAGLALAACSGDLGTGTTGTTALSIKLKDAPGDIAHAFVTIEQIVLVGADGTVVLRDEPYTGDLLTLKDDVVDLVDDVDVPSGRYAALRFVISGACIAVENTSGENDIYTTDGYDATPCGGEATGVLQTPSYPQSGLKVVLSGNALNLTEIGRAHV